MTSDWPPPIPRRLPPPPKGDDGPARFVEWVYIRYCPECGHWLAWRDQYLRLHCEACQPPQARRWAPVAERPPEPPAGAEVIEEAEATEIKQLRLL